MSYEKHKGKLPEWMPKVNLKNITEDNSPGLIPGEYPYEEVDANAQMKPQEHTEYHGIQYSK